MLPKSWFASLVGVPHSLLVTAEIKDDFSGIEKGIGIEFAFLIY